MSLLAMCAARSGVAKVKFPEPLNARQWVALIIMVHRAYLAGLITAIEALRFGDTAIFVITGFPAFAGSDSR